MSKKNSPKKLVFFKETIAHLNKRQMNVALGGQDTLPAETFTCPKADGNSISPEKVLTGDCTLLKC